MVNNICIICHAHVFVSVFSLLLLFYLRYICQEFNIVLGFFKQLQFSHKNNIQFGVYKYMYRSLNNCMYMWLIVYQARPIVGENTVSLDNNSL